MAFDCLYLRGRDLREHPLHARRPALETLLACQTVLLPVRRLDADGLVAWQQAVARGFEGIVAKDPATPYVGGRTLKWLKVKQREYRVKERGFYDPGRV
jgi:ATP-dependent DNA ligase